MARRLQQSLQRLTGVAIVVDDDDSGSGIHESASLSHGKL